MYSTFLRCVVYFLYMLYFKMPCVYCCNCLVYIVVSCLVCIFVVVLSVLLQMFVCIFVVVLCVFL